MRTLLAAAAALALAGTPALAGQEQYPTDLPTLVFLTPTVLENGSNAEMRFTAISRAVAIVQGTTAGSSAECLPEPAERFATYLAARLERAEGSVPARTVLVRQRPSSLDDRPGERASAMSGR